MYNHTKPYNCLTDNKFETSSFQSKLRSILNPSDYDFDEQMMNENIESSKNIPFSCCSNQKRQPLLQIDEDQQLYMIHQILNKQSKNEHVTQNISLLTPKKNKKSQIARISQKVKKQIYNIVGINQRKNKKVNVEQFYQKKYKKLQILRMKQQQQLMKQCTFTPRTTNKYNQHRNLSQFLQSQSEFTNRVENKKNLMRSQKEQKQKQSQSFSPLISKGHPSNKTKPAYQKLYQLNTIQQRNPHKQIQFENYNHSITSRSHNKSPIMTDRSNRGELLYEDALRRQTFKKPTFQHHHDQNLTEQVKEQKRIKKKNEKFVAQKFIRQYCQILKQFNLLSVVSFQPEESQEICNYQVNEAIEFRQFKNILFELGFLSCSQNDEAELAQKQKNLILEAYYVISPYTVNIKNICIFLLAILGVYNVNPINFTTKPKQYANHFYLDQKQGKKIHTFFDLLYCNKLSSTYRKSKLKKQTKFPNSPKTSHKNKQLTQQLASKYRQKLVQKAHSIFLSSKNDVNISNHTVLSHPDQLVINQIGKNLLMETKRKKKQELNENFTFCPKTNRTSHKNTNSRAKSQRGIEKSIQLDEKAKSNSKQKQQIPHSQCLKTQSQIEQYTKQNFPSSRIEKKQKIFNTKNVQKIDRMHFAHLQRTQKIKFMQKGELIRNINKEKNHKQNNTKNCNKNPEQYQKANTNEAHLLNMNNFILNQQQLLLMIDINIEQQCYNLKFFNGDQNRIQTIVNQFCENLSLDQQSKKELLWLVSSQINKLMKRQSIII